MDLKSLWKSFWVRKSIADQQADAGANSDLRRVLGPVDLTLLGVGAIVGTGIFILSGQVAAHHAGPAVILSYIFAGGAALAAALCYSEIASMVAGAGSAYAYVYASMGELVAWIIGWDLLLEYLLAGATVSVGWSAYVRAFIKHAFGYDLPSQWSSAPLAWNDATSQFYHTGAYVNLPAVGIIVLLTGMLILGVKESARVNAITVFIKVAVILLFVFFAAPHVEPSNWVPFLPENQGGVFGKFGWSGVLTGTSTLFFAYNGFDAISTAAQEARNPQRDLPIAMLASVLIAAALYIAVATVLTGVVPFAQLGVPHPVSVGIEAAHVTWLQPIIEIGAIAGLTSVMLVNLLSQPRITYAMSKDGLLPGVAGRVHRTFRTPYLATGFGGLVCALAGGLFPIDVLGELMCVGTLFAFLLVSLGTLVLRRTDPDAPRRFKAPGGAFGVPLLATVTCGVLLYTSQPAAINRFGVWLALGLVFYFAYSRKHSRVAARARAVLRDR